ncbi:hypothetical protein PsYK624_054050 [Phanerochaete sordida]|uniref:Uncharacterized protein n=1 Tax=Phanerochaete sordida TaxID=48140 RepID=A0A9P3LCK3_9APHY|nr:hypothetical protein PsYK624_054050 [Phanerochaete sordida]
MLFDVPDAATVIEVLIRARKRERLEENAPKRRETEQHPSRASTTPSTTVGSLGPQVRSHKSLSSVKTGFASEVEGRCVAPPVNGNRGS